MKKHIMGKHMTVRNCSALAILWRITIWGSILKNHNMRKHIEKSHYEEAYDKITSCSRLSPALLVGVPLHPATSPRSTAVQIASHHITLCCEESQYEESYDKSFLLLSPTKTPAWWTVLQRASEVCWIITRCTTDDSTAFCIPAFRPLPGDIQSHP